AEDYIARLRQFGRVFEQQLEGMRLRERKGILPPRFVVEKVLAETRAFAGAPAVENILYTSLVEKLDALDPPLEAGEREHLLRDTAAAIEAEVQPAYRSLIAYYEELLPRARGNNGAWELPDGEACYALQVRHHTTTDMTPADVHALGLAE